MPGCGAATDKTGMVPVWRCRVCRKIPTILPANLVGMYTQSDGCAWTMYVEKYLRIGTYLTAADRGGLLAQGITVRA